MKLEYREHGKSGPWIPCQDNEAAEAHALATYRRIREAKRALADGAALTDGLQDFRKVMERPK